MARVSLESVIQGDFVNRFRGLASGGSSATQQALSALRGNASNVTLSDGLRTGARIFSESMRSLNSVSALVNISRDRLEQLSGLTDKMIGLAERASKSSIGQQQRNSLDSEFQKLGNDFQRIVESTKLGDRQLLKVEDLSQIFERVGLDKEQSRSIAEVFAQFVLSSEDDFLASEEIKGERPVRVPRQVAAGQSTEFASLFSSDSNIRTQGNAYRVLTDLNALAGQIKDNSKALDAALATIGENMELVRATGLAFLDLSNQVEKVSDADELASMLRKEIRKNAGLASRQAENLEPLVIAALAAEQS